MKIEDGSAIRAIKETAAQQDLKLSQKNSQSQNGGNSNTGKILKADPETLNKLAILVGYDLRFKVHKATKQLIVQVVDSTQYPEKIIKEIPEEKFLDILAQIKNAVGTFMDDYA